MADLRFVDKVKQLPRFSTTPASRSTPQARRLQKNMQTTDAELDYLFTSHPRSARPIPMELPAPGRTAPRMLKRMAQFAEKHKVFVAYHTHAQGSMTVFDEALKMSKWNMLNVDLGHYVAAGSAAVHRSSSCRLTTTASRASI